MCMMSTPKAPPPVAIPDAPPPVPDVQPAAQGSDPSIQQSRNDDRARRLRAAQGNSTLVTGGGGLVNQANTGLKQAFGA